MCRETEVSRAGFYRRWRESAPREEETGLRGLIQRLAMETRAYGYRRIGAALRRQGWIVNHKRVLRLMREDNLLSLRHKGFVPATTDSGHPWRVYPNLARGMGLTGLNQLWVADITYIRLREEFVYLAVILDAYSRRVVGWALERHLEASLAVAALDKAVAGRAVPEGMVHHSDRGVQYASRDYVERLEGCKIQISMSRPANPYDNAKAESFFKTLKAEQLDGSEYRDLEDLLPRAELMLERYYNEHRMHSALGYRSPAEFEQALAGK